MLGAFDELAGRLERRERDVMLWPEWSVSARVDARAHWRQAWRAIRCHRSQVAIYGGLDELTDEQHETLWGSQPFYRAFSLVDGSADMETDLFTGVE